MSVHDEKARLRATMLRRRQTTVAPGAAARLCDAFRPLLEADGFPAPGSVVSGYWPMADELDVRPLLALVTERGFAGALPVVVGRDSPLVFRRWRPGDVLESGTFGTSHPGMHAPEARPDAVLAPLLAFDAEGHRIGWGGGYYDRTLRALRARGRVLAIGIGYAAQRVDAVPHDATDEPLDWVVTEEAAMRTGAP